MGDYTMTKSKNLVFYTSPKDAYLVNLTTAYQIVHVNQGNLGKRYKAVRNITKLIESGKVKSVDELCFVLKPQLKLQYTQRKPWVNQ